MDTKFFIDQVALVIELLKEKEMALSTLVNDSILVYDVDKFNEIAGALGKDVQETTCESDTFTHKVFIIYQGIEIYTYVRKEAEA